MWWVKIPLDYTPSGDIFFNFEKGTVATLKFDGSFQKLSHQQTLKITWPLAGAEEQYNFRWGSAKKYSNKFVFPKEEGVTI